MTHDRLSILTRLISSRAGDSAKPGAGAEAAAAAFARSPVAFFARLLRAAAKEEAAGLEAAPADLAFEVDGADAVGGERLIDDPAVAEVVVEGGGGGGGGIVVDLPDMPEKQGKPEMHFKISFHSLDGFTVTHILQ